MRRFIPRHGTELDRTQAAIKEEWRRREEEDDKVGGTTRGEREAREETVGIGTVATPSTGDILETEGPSQIPGSTWVDTSSVEVIANATRPLLICWGGTCDSGHQQGTPQIDGNR
jgi:hypothetical protein